MSRTFSLSTLGFTLGLLTMIALAAVGAMSLRRCEQTAARVSHVQEVSHAVFGLLSGVREAEAGAHSYVMAGREQDLQAHRRADQRTAEALADLQRLTLGGRPQHRQRVQSLAALTDQEGIALDRAIRARREHSPDAAVQMLLDQQASQTMEQLERVGNVLYRAETRILAEQTQAAEQQRRRLAVVTLAGVIMAVLLMGFAFWQAQQRRRELTRQSEELQKTVQLLDLANVMVLDWEGRIVRWNRGVQRIYGFSSEQALGQRCTDLLQTVASEPLEKIRQSLLETGQWTGELTQRRRDGQQVIMASLWVLHRDPQGQPAAILEINNDITDRKRFEEQLQESQRFQQRMLEITPSLIYVYDLIDDRTVYVNPRVHAILGYTPEQILAMGSEVFRTVLSENDQQRVRKAIEDYLFVKDGQVLEWEAQFRCASGEWRWLQGHEMVFTRAPDGRPRQTLGTAEDVTERMQAQEALRQSEERYRTLFELSPDGVALVGLDGSIAAFNERICRQLGYAPEEFAGLKVADLEAQENLEAIRRHMQRMLQAGTERFETRHRTKQGEVRDVAVSARRVDLGGKVYFLCVWRDITPQKQMEQQLRQAKQAAEQATQAAESANQAKDQFLAVLSHELRTPLTPVLAAVSLLESDQRLDRKMQQDMQIIRRNVELEARLIDDLLDLTRIVRGKLELRRDNVDIHVLLERAVGICCQSEVFGKQLRISKSWDATAHQMWGDPVRLEQVFWNLLNNAVKFTPASGRIEIRSFNPDPDHIGVEVRDSGVGIEPQVIERLFNAFEQGERSTTRQFGGLGLGLAITKRLVEMHGGRITAHSEGKGKGATFTVELPLLAGMAAPVGPVEHSPAQMPVGQARKLRILLVEDHADTARIMRQLLMLDGHEVKTAGDVASALDTARREDFDLIISDLGLPDGSGLDVMRNLRQTRRSVRGIALSGFGRQEDVDRSRDAGFTEHLTKPVDLGHLNAAIARVIE